MTNEGQFYEYRDAMAEQIRMMGSDYVGGGAPLSLWEGMTPQQAISACDTFAAHPDDPLKPEGVEGVRYERDIDVSKTIVCTLARMAAPDSPRLQFQIERMHLAGWQRSRPGEYTAASRSRFERAYRNGSEMAGLYLVTFPFQHPPTDAEIIANIERIVNDNHRANQASNNAQWLDQNMDQLLIGSVVVIFSAALINSYLNPDAAAQGEYMLSASTHEITCNGFVVGHF